MRRRVRGTRTRRAFLQQGSIGAAGLLVACADEPPLRHTAESLPPAHVDRHADDQTHVNALPDREEHGADDEEAADDLPVIEGVASLELSSAFPLGIASGDATPDGALLWCLARTSLPLALYVFDAEGGAQVLAVRVVADDGGFVHRPVTGLVGGRRYRFAFIELGPDDVAVARSELGIFRTALPAGALGVVRLGAASCTSNTFLRHETLEHAGARTDLDAFLLLGDTCYTDEITDIANAPAQTLLEYRARWEHNLAKDGYLALRASTSVVATWDDHEIYDAWNPESIDPARLAAGTQAFFEHLPIRRDGTSPNRLWRSMRWGACAEVFVLDSRSERRPSTIGSSAPEYISPAQLQWLKTALAASPCVFKVIMASVPITDIPLPESEDRWTTYGAQRDEILRFIDDAGLTGIIWLAGDVHFGALARVSTSGAGSNQIEVIAGPGRQIPLSLGFNFISYLEALPQFDYATDDNNYVELELDPLLERATVRYFGLDGTLLHEDAYDAA